MNPSLSFQREEKKKGKRKHDSSSLQMGWLSERRLLEKGPGTRNFPKEKLRPRLSTHHPPQGPHDGLTWQGRHPGSGAMYAAHHLDHCRFAGVCAEALSCSTNLILPWFRPTYWGIANFSLDICVIHVSPWFIPTCVSIFIAFLKFSIFDISWGKRSSSRKLELSDYLWELSVYWETLILSEGPEELALFIWWTHEKALLYGMLIRYVLVRTFWSCVGTGRSQHREGADVPSCTGFWQIVIKWCNI